MSMDRNGGRRVIGDMLLPISAYDPVFFSTYTTRIFHPQTQLEPFQYMQMHNAASQCAEPSRDRLGH